MSCFLYRCKIVCYFLLRNWYMSVVKAQRVSFLLKYFSGSIFRKVNLHMTDDTLSLSNLSHIFLLNVSLLLDLYWNRLATWFQLNLVKRLFLMQFQWILFVFCGNYYFQKLSALKVIYFVCKKEENKTLILHIYCMLQKTFWVKKKHYFSQLPHAAM